MTAILQLLRSLQSYTPNLCDDADNKLWSFKANILTFTKPDEPANKADTKPSGIEFFRPFIDDYPHLLVIYALYCSLIAKKLKSSNSIDVNDPIFEAHLINALALSNLLHVINWQYFDSPKERRLLEKEEVVFRFLLREFGYQFKLINEMDLPEDDEAARQAHEQPFSSWFRGVMGSSNWPRLFILRVKRMLDTMLPIFKGLPNFVRAVYFIDQFANPFFAYLAWIFYVPRLTLNLFILLKNVIPHPWMSAQQQQLSYILRCKLQLHDKWFELTNDSVWLAVGLINCFFLIGVLAPWAMYLTVALYAFDVTLAGIRAHVEFRKLRKLRHKLVNLLSANTRSSNPSNPANQIEKQILAEQLHAYVDELDKHILYESLRMGLSLGTTIGLFVGMLFAMPALAGNPMVPLIGASFIVLFCICTLVAGKYIEKLKPAESLPTLVDIDMMDGLRSKLTKSHSLDFDLLHQGQAAAAGVSSAEIVGPKVEDKNGGNSQASPRSRYSFHKCQTSKSDSYSSTMSSISSFA